MGKFDLNMLRVDVKRGFKTQNSQNLLLLGLPHSSISYN